ncbi:MAG: AEC family transporter [Defluviitaleaceae bacterium]|nr:AEC family transporter [Defluviitaleaceae bacterium]
MFQTVLTNLIPMGIMMAIGLIARKTRLINDEISGGMSKILVNITLPAMLIMGMQREFSAQLLGSGLMVLGLTATQILLFCGFGFLVARLLKFPKEKRGAFGSAVAFGNVGFMGIPIIVAILGYEALFYAAIAQIPFNLLLFSLGTGIMSKSEVKTKFRPNTAFIAAFVGLGIFLTGWQIPDPISITLQHLGNMTTPLSMLIMGAMIAKQPPKKLVGDKTVLVLAMIKLIAVPTITWLALRHFISDPLALGTLIVLGAMPTAVMVVICAKENAPAVEYASKAVFVTTVLSLLTLPLVSLIL